MPCRRAVRRRDVRRRDVTALLDGAALGPGLWPVARAAGVLPIFDADAHYSHDAWDLVPPRQALSILRQAGLRGALVSASSTCSGPTPTWPCPGAWWRWRENVVCCCTPVPTSTP